MYYTAVGCSTRRLHPRPEIRAVTMDTTFDLSVVHEDSHDEAAAVDDFGIAGSVLQLLAIAASWVTLRPYLGIVHDARLYFHYARFSDAPGFSEVDLIVSNDRQMSRTAYARASRVLIDTFGFANAAMVAAVAGVLAWVVAISTLGRSLFGRDWWLLAVFAPAFPAHWGPLFSLAEPFAAPRALSAALAIGAVASAVSGRFVVSVPLLLAAGLIHPLVALPGVGIVLVLACIRWRRIVAAVIVVGGFALAFAVVDPLLIAGTEVFDASWLGVIENHAHIVLPKEWIQETWVLTVFGFVVVGATWLRSTSDRIRAFSAAAAITGGVGLAISLVFAMIWINPMIVQLQPWRALWAVHLAALVGLVDFGLTALRVRSREAVLAFVAVLGVTVAAGVQVPLVWFGLQVAVAIPFLIPLRPDQFARLCRWRLDVLLVVMAVGMTVAQIAAALARLVTAESLDSVPWVLYTASYPGATLALAALIAAIAVGYRFMHNRTLARAAALAGVFALLGVVAVGLWTWDQRTDWQVLTEELDSPVFDLPEDSLVLSEDGSIAAVTLTHRPMFVTNYGAAGVAFSKDLANDVAVRSEIARSVGIPWAVDFDTGIADYSDWVKPTATQIREACSQPGSPTHMILFREADGLPGVVWRSPVPIIVVDERNPAVLPDALVLYTCAEILP